MHLFENSHHTTKQILKRNDTHEIKGKRKQKDIILSLADRSSTILKVFC